MGEHAPRGDRFAALRHRNFTVLWAGLIVSNIGTWMQNVAQAWLVLQFTDSPLWLGILALSFALPMTVGPLVSGVLVDRMDRVRLLWITQIGMMAVAVALAALTWLRVVGVGHILVASFINSSLLAFDNPTRRSLIPDLVPRQDLLNAVSLSAATFNGAALVGPAIAGALLGRFDAALLFALNAISYLAVLMALFALRGVDARGNGSPTPFGRSVLSGLAYSWQNRLVFVLLGLSAVAAIFGRSYQSLLPIFARDIWHGGPQGYGLLLSAAGAGALAGAFGLAAFREVRQQGAAMLANGLLFAASLAAFALGRSIAFGFWMLFVAGVTSTIFAAIAATHLQLATPNELRGRVMSLYTITLIGLPSLGALGSSALAEWLGGVRGAPSAVLIGAGVTATALAFTGPRLRRENLSGETSRVPEGAT